MTNPTHDYYARSHHDHDHAHDHDHDDHKVPNPANEHDNGPPGEYEIMSRAMQELLELKGLITAEQVAKRMEQFDEEFPYRGAQIVARAWTDPAYKQRLLDDGRAACAEAGVMLEAERLIAVENTPAVHNVIVCTLCSCYPRELLGMPPTWYIAEKSSTVKLKGTKRDTSNNRPGAKVSYCVTLLANPDPSRTMTVPLKPNALPRPTATSSASSDT